MPIYSHSRLGAFESCPRKYWYAYIGKPEIERFDTVEAFLGSRVHEALEELYKRLMGGRQMSRDEVLGWYDSEWDRQWHDGVLVVSKTLKANDYREAGREALTAYYLRHQPFDQGRTLKLEAQVFIDLDPAGRYRLQGYIDRLAQRDDGAYEIHDYKTANSLPTQAEADADRQLALYQIGVQAAWPEARQVHLIWHYLRFDQEIVSRRTGEQLDAVRRQCIATIDDIESRGQEEAGFPTCPSYLCKWCEYNAICPG